MRPLGWALKQPAWCPYKKRTFGHMGPPGILMHGGKTMGRHWEDHQPRTEERAHRRKQPCCHLDLGRVASSTARKYISVV